MLKSTTVNIERLNKVAEQFGYKVERGIVPYIKNTCLNTSIPIVKLVVEMDGMLENIKRVNVAVCSFGTEPGENEISDIISLAMKCADALNQIIGVEEIL